MCVTPASTGGGTIGGKFANQAREWAGSSFVGAYHFAKGAEADEAHPASKWMSHWHARAANGSAGVQVIPMSFDAGLESQGAQKTPRPSRHISGRDRTTPLSKFATQGRYAEVVPAAPESLPFLGSPCKFATMSLSALAPTRQGKRAAIRWALVRRSHRR